MLGRNLDELLDAPASHRTAILEGRWLEHGTKQAIVGLEPVGVLEGGGEILEELPSWLTWHAREYPEGAAIGFLAYELARFFERLPLTRDEVLPDLSFTYYARIDRVPGRRAAYAVAGPIHSEARSNFEQTRYLEAVAQIREYAAAGDIYQANLTQQFTVKLDGLLPEQAYRRLPMGGAPFRAFLRSPEWTVISNSPERFFRIAGRRILTSPIKGTIARGAGAAEDTLQMATLLSSGKDRAENIMIVDLLRNDLGRICRFGSIGVQLYEVVELPHLFHLVSHVRGTLRAETTLVDVLRALFPCGSVTGAPKIRAMEILSEIERVPRGLSMGAIGIIVGDPASAHCEMDFNVAIRTMTVRGKVAVFNVGGGIVHESRPETEYEEMLLKAKPLFDALGTSDYPESKVEPAFLFQGHR